MIEQRKCNDPKCDEPAASFCWRHATATERVLRRRLKALQAELDDLRELHACDLSLLKRESERCDRYADVHIDDEQPKEDK